MVEEGEALVSVFRVAGAENADINGTLSERRNPAYRTLPAFAPSEARSWSGLGISLARISQQRAGFFHRTARAQRQQSRRQPRFSRRVGARKNIRLGVYSIVPMACCRRRAAHSSDLGFPASNPTY